MTRKWRIAASALAVVGVAISLAHLPAPLPSEGTLLVVGDPSQDRAALEGWARRLGARVVSDRGLGFKDRGGTSLVLIGRPEGNAVVREIEPRLPVRFLPQGFEFGGRTYTRPEHQIVLQIPSPWRADRTLVVVAGATVDTPLSFRGLRRRDYVISEGRRLQRYGRLTGGQVDPAGDVDRDREWEAWEARQCVTRTPHFDVFYDGRSLAEFEAERLAQSLEGRWEKASRRLGTEADLRVSYRLYPSSEIKGKLTDSVALSHLDLEAKTVHALFRAGRDGVHDAREMRFLLQTSWGAPSSERLGRGLELFLAGEEPSPSAAVLAKMGFAPSDDDQSPVADAYARSWAGFLWESLGRERFRALYQGRAAGADVASLERAWRGRLTREKVPARTAPGYNPVVFHRGFNYAYTNDRESGYTTGRSLESLRALARGGASAVALVPYGFSSRESLTTIRRAGDSIYTESDESLRVAVGHARALGLAVMLKPQIWVSADFWPSTIDFASETDWDRWFQSYEKWILSYALLAEELHVDLFCVGTELTRATLEQPARFKKLIAAVRRVYRGPVTYAANWYEEFDHISFWKELDLVGLDNYFPLDEGTDLRRNAAAVAERVERVAIESGRPILFTEVGFPSGRGPEGVARQALLYRITFETYWTRPWFKGLYWWKWFSDPENSGPTGDPWTPRGKPAERVVWDWFTREARAPDPR